MPVLAQPARHRVALVVDGQVAVAAPGQDDHRRAGGLAPSAAGGRSATGLWMLAMRRTPSVAVDHLRARSCPRSRARPSATAGPPGGRGAAQTGARASETDGEQRDGQRSHGAGSSGGGRNFTHAGDGTAAKTPDGFSRPLPASMRDDQHGVGVLVGDRQVLGRGLDAEVARRLSARALLLDVGQRPLVRRRCANSTTLLWPRFET